jgi:lipoprotein-releasing system permease protein
VLVVEKTKDIGTLKALGMSQDNVRKIFTYQGLIIGACGTVLGASSGIILCTFLKKYQFIKLPKDIYYIDRLPVEIQFWPDVFLIVAVAMFIALFATVYPARKAAGLRPVEALRYE